MEEVGMAFPNGPPSDMRVVRRLASITLGLYEWTEG